MVKGYHHTADHNLAFDKVKSSRNTCAFVCSVLLFGFICTNE